MGSRRQAGTVTHMTFSYTTHAESHTPELDFVLEIRAFNIAIGFVYYMLACLELLYLINSRCHMGKRCKFKFIVLDKIFFS